MGRKTVLVDDLDGKELDEGTQPVNLSLGRTTYRIYLSEANHGKLLKALDPFISNAETTSSAPTARGGRRQTTALNTYGYDTSDVRTWAQANNVKNDNGNPVGDRGRLSQGVYDAYHDAHR